MLPTTSSGSKRPDSILVGALMLGCFHRVHYSLAAESSTRRGGRKTERCNGLSFLSVTGHNIVGTSRRAEVCGPLTQGGGGQMSASPGFRFQPHTSPTETLRDLHILHVCVCVCA